MSTENEVLFERAVGRSPLVISLPHVGTAIPAEIARRMTPRARQVEDTDWHVDRLYRFARVAGASWLQARLSRYVIDLNRPPDDHSLYPGQASTGLCPPASFSGESLYAASPPTAAEVGARRERYWMPYHDALKLLIAGARRRHGFAVLLDAHSIRSVVPRLFAGRLPDINLGTNDGRSCDPLLAAGLVAQLATQRDFTHVLNGRFKGGYITRTYGEPHAGVHAVQIELAQAAYMDESGHSFEDSLAEPLRNLLRSLVAVLAKFRPLGVSPDGSA
ncbi:MAG TPA: N-formylglutamate deformylase [Steroidobacteraceae bacterium]|nr:N-formylglutamate deformylase [Steroidobacteraceae bacterium]